MKGSGIRPKFTRPADWLLLLLIAAAVVLFVLFAGRGRRDAARYAAVSVDGVRVAALPLGEDAVFSPAEGVVVRVQDGAARIEESDCPDQICVKAGWLRRSGQSAVCLPRRVVLRIESEGAAQDVPPDAVTH